jgi:hypothetical protein
MQGADLTRLTPFVNALAQSVNQSHPLLIKLMAIKDDKSPRTALLMGD